MVTSRNLPSHAFMASYTPPAMEYGGLRLVRTSANTSATSSLCLPRSSSVISLLPAFHAFAMGVNGEFWARSRMGSLSPKRPSPIRRMDASQAEIPPVPLPTAWK